MQFIKVSEVIRAAGILLLLSAILVQMSCTTARNLRISEEEKPVRLFDRYKIDIKGGAGEDSLYHVVIKVEFIDTVPGGADIDKIPILSIDSICFGCVAIESQDCIGLESSYEREQRWIRAGDTSFIPIKWSTNDLFFDKGELHPVSLYDVELVRIPKECQNVIAQFTARLTDRVTGEEISQESKSLKLNVKKKRVLRSMD